MELAVVIDELIIVRSETMEIPLEQIPDPIPAPFDPREEITLLLIMIRATLDVPPSPDPLPIPAAFDPVAVIVASRISMIPHAPFNPDPIPGPLLPMTDNSPPLADAIEMLLFLAHSRPTFSELMMFELFRVIKTEELRTNTGDIPVRVTPSKRRETRELETTMREVELEPVIIRGSVKFKKSIRALHCRIVFSEITTDPSLKLHLLTSEGSGDGAGEGLLISMSA
jgi:hypothetical protein